MMTTPPLTPRPPSNQASAPPRLDFRRLDLASLRRYCLAFRIPVHAGASLNELVQAVARHFENELVVREEEVLPAFEEFVLTYNGGNVIEDIRKTRSKEVSKRARKRTRRAGETSGEEDNANFTLDEDGNQQQPVFCICKRPSFGEMIGCDNPTCEIEWFHVSCVNLKEGETRGKWFCPICTRKQETSGGARKKTRRD